MSHNNQYRREAKIIATIACPTCGAPVGQLCREGVQPHDERRGAEDLRPLLARVHCDRRAAWVATREANAS